MKAICGSVNFDLFMVLPRPAARITHPLNWNFPAKIGPETGKQVNEALDCAALNLPALSRIVGHGRSGEPKLRGRAEGSNSCGVVGGDGMNHGQDRRYANCLGGKT